MKKLLAFLLTICLLAGLASFTGAVAEPAAELPGALPEIGAVISGFKVKEITPIDYLSAELVFMEHEKTGAQLLYIANEDTERSFSVAFRTVAEDDKGLPHVFEHSALSGSDKYPSSNLFFQMIAQTYSTFLNALTYSLDTVYPSSSLSEEQLLKFVEVYMSGVLHPQLLTDERAMKREAYRYELTDVDADLTVTGTVYSEMQGALANLSAMAYYNLSKLLYPGSHSSYITGGVPADILTMTYQDLLDFHAKYYHPSNMLMTLYGKVDYERFLELLDTEYLSAYDRKEIVIADNGYEPFEGYREQICEFPVSADASTEKGSVMYYGYVLNGATLTDGLVGSIVATAFNMESSPLQKLAREKLPDAAIGCGINLETPIPSMIFTAMNVDEADKDTFKSIVEEAIAQTAKDGIDDSVVDALINSNTFQLLLTPESHQIGVNLAQKICQRWSLSGDPLAYLDEIKFTENIAAYAEDGSIDAFTGKYLLNPSQTAMAVTNPVPGLEEKRNEELLQQLADKKAAMSDEEIAKLVQDTADFAAWTQANQEVSMIDQVKVVDVATLPEEASEPVVEEAVADGVRVLTSAVNVESVVVSELLLNADMIPFDMLHDYEFYVSLLGSMPTEKYSLEELQAQLGVTVNNLRFSSGAMLPKEGGYDPYLSLSMMMLDSKLSEAYDLAEEILFRTDLSELDRIRSHAGEAVVMDKQMLASAPHVYGQSIGRAAVDEDQLYNEYLTGFAYTDYLKKVAAMSDEELKALTERMYAARDLLLNREGLTLVCVSNEAGIAANNARAMELVSRLGTVAHEAVDYSADLPKLPKSIAVVVDGTMQFNMLMAASEDLGYEMNGKLLAMNKVTYDRIFIPTIRFENGSYSVINSISEDTMYEQSYRDPELTKTYEVYAGTGERLRALPLTQADLDGFITAAYSSLALPDGPLSSAMNAIEDTLANKREIGRKQRMMSELKQFTAKDVAEYAELYDLLSEKGVRVTVGSAAMIEANKDMFDLIIHAADAE